VIERGIVTGRGKSNVDVSKLQVLCSPLLSFADKATGYEDSAYNDYDDGYGRRPPSPPHASGGYSQPPPPAGDFYAYPNNATTNLANQVPPQSNVPYPPYNPQDYPMYPPPAGAPPNSAPTAGPIPPPSSGANPRPPIDPLGPEHVSEASRDGPPRSSIARAATVPVTGPGSKGAFYRAFGVPIPLGQPTNTITTLCSRDCADLLNRWCKA